MTYSLLSDSVARVKVADARGDISVSLPGLYEHLMADRVSAVTALRPHQKHALHAFLVQVGALALVAANRASPPDTAAEWRDLLRGLTRGYPGDEPWTLIVPDLSKPALLQPPVPEGSLEVLKDVEVTPDSLDMLVTSKNHDLKARRMSDAAPDEWFFALLTLQTTEGFLGAGNYGISRMNGGFGSRPSVGITPKGRWGARVKRDICRLTACRETYFDEYAFFVRSGGIGLVWLEPWDGATQLQPKQLDPFYVEICRRVRLVQAAGRSVARRGTSKAARIAFPEKYNGITGDPWTPVDKSAGKALTVDGSGFHYRKVSDLINPALFGAAPLQIAALEDGAEGLMLGFSATVRGQGETQGHHERTIRIPPKLTGVFAKSNGRDKLAELAKARVEHAGRMRLKVLKPALLSLFQNAPTKINYKHSASNDKAEPFLAALDREIDRTFFDDLFAELGADDPETKDEIRRKWLLTLKDHAKRQLATAEAGSPLSHVRRYQSRAAAQRRLDGAFYGIFENYFPKPRANSNERGVP